MKIKAINKGSEAKSLAFQEFLGFTLPDDYFNFLAQMTVLPLMKPISM